MNEIGATGVPYQSTDFLVGTVGKRTLSGSNKETLPATSLVVDASFNGSESVPVALVFNTTTSTLSKYVDATSNTSAYSADIRAKTGSTSKSVRQRSPKVGFCVQPLPSFSRWFGARWSNRTKCSGWV